MVQVIEDKDEADGAEYIEFAVWRTPAGDIRGRWQHSRKEPGGFASVMSNEPFTSVEDEYQRVVDWAEYCDVPFVWVNDPQRWFPAFKRPGS